MMRAFLIRILGIGSMLVGFALVVWFLFNVADPTPGFRQYFHSPFQLVLPTALILFGWRWIRYEGPGIEDIPANFQCDELRDSISEAKATLPQFIAEVTQNVDGAYIKFPLKTPKGLTEHIWAYVHYFRDGVFNVSLANAPIDDSQSTTGRRDVPESEVEDWQIMLPDGRLKGAFSLIALFRHFEKQKKRLSPKMRKQKAQLINYPAPSITPPR